MFSFQIFVGSRRELVANSIHTADADATQLDSWVASASASAVCIGHKVRGGLTNFRKDPVLYSSATAAKTMRY